MNKIKIGDTFIEKVKFTQNQVNQFAEISGDKNPIHIDAGYAAKTPFGKPIIHGIFAASVFSKVFGTQWPGEGTIYMFQDIFFKAPAFVEVEYIAKFETIEINEEKHRGVIRCTLEDSEGKIIISGQAKLMHTERF